MLKYNFNIDIDTDEKPLTLLKLVFNDDAQIIERYKRIINDKISGNVEYLTQEDNDFINNPYVSLFAKNYNLLYVVNNKKLLLQLIENEYNAQQYNILKNKVYNVNLNWISLSKRLKDLESLFCEFYRKGQYIIGYVDIDSWDVSHVIHMSELFAHTQFLMDISKWDVSRVKFMGRMFANSKFNGDISNWNTSNVIDMDGMFEESEFNGDISNWNTFNVEYMFSMFYENKVFNQDISKWNVSNVTTMEYMFYGSVFDKPISRWNIRNCQNFSNMFTNSKFNQNISNWDFSKSHINYKNFAHNSILEKHPNFMPKFSDNIMNESTFNFNIDVEPDQKQTGILRQKFEDVSIKRLLLQMFVDDCTFWKLEENEKLDYEIINNKVLYVYYNSEYISNRVLSYQLSISSTGGLMFAFNPHFLIGYRMSITNGVGFFEPIEALKKFNEKNGTRIEFDTMISSLSIPGTLKSETILLNKFDMYKNYLPKHFYITSEDLKDHENIFDDIHSSSNDTLCLIANMEHNQVAKNKSDMKCITYEDDNKLNPLIQYLRNNKITQYYIKTPIYPGYRYDEGNRLLTKKYYSLGIDVSEDTFKRAGFKFNEKLFEDILKKINMIIQKPKKVSQDINIGLSKKFELFAHPKTIVHKKAFFENVILTFAFVSVYYNVPFLPERVKKCIEGRQSYPDVVYAFNDIPASALLYYLNRNTDLGYNLNDIIEKAKIAYEYVLQNWEISK